jgi:hypothetical protein
VYSLVYQIEGPMASQNGSECFDTGAAVALCKVPRPVILSEARNERNRRIAVDFRPIAKAKVTGNPSTTLAKARVVAQDDVVGTRSR